MGIIVAITIPSSIADRRFLHFYPLYLPIPGVLLLSLLLRIARSAPDTFARPSTTGQDAHSRAPCLCRLALSLSS